MIRNPKLRPALAAAVVALVAVAGCSFDGKASDVECGDFLKMDAAKQASTIASFAKELEDPGTNDELGAAMLIGCGMLPDSTLGEVVEALEESAG